jgi:hypothetical protein
VRDAPASLSYLAFHVGRRLAGASPKSNSQASVVPQDESE